MDTNRFPHPWPALDNAAAREAAAACAARLATRNHRAEFTGTMSQWSKIELVPNASNPTLMDEAVIYFWRAEYRVKFLPRRRFQVQHYDIHSEIVRTAIGTYYDRH